MAREEVEGLATAEGGPANVSTEVADDALSVAREEVEGLAAAEGGPANVSTEVADDDL